MISHYIKIFSRSLWKNKTFSLINITGLCTGITCCLLIAIYIRHELSYDQFQEKGDRIVRVIMEYSFNGTVNKGNYTSTKVAPAFTRNFAEVETGVRMYQRSHIIRYKEKLFNEKRVLFADSTFFRLFSFRLLKGNPAAALNGPNAIVLTESAAKKYFGSADPLGQIMKVGSNETPYLINGIIEDCPSNSQIKFDFLASFSSLGEIQEETYWNANYTTYLLLKNALLIAPLQEKIPGFMKKEMAGELQGADYVSFELERFRSVHLFSEHAGFEPNGSITYVYILSAVALLILVIACFTFINLSTARSVERAREIGIRKVSGAYKKQIFWQFIGESAYLSFLCLLLSYGAVQLLLPGFNALTERQLDGAALFSPSVMVVALLLVLVISFFAGVYPGVVLSAFQPAKVLKGVFKNTGQGLWLRQSLFVFQFVISVFLIVCTVVIREQLHYIQNKALGYDREQVIVLPCDQKILGKFELLRQQLKGNPHIRYVSRANSTPAYIQGGYAMSRPDMPKDQQLPVVANPVDEEYLLVNGMKLLAGNNLTAQNMKDATTGDPEKRTFTYILNRSAAAKLGWSPEEAVGKTMFLGETRPGRVCGVVEDFHFASLREPIQPLVLFTEEWSSLLLVKITGADLPKTISFMDQAWKKIASHRPFEYHFLDEEYDKLYRSEIRLGKVMGIFAGIAILLACLGLFGLSSYTIQQRTKEIGILRVLGASIPHIAGRLSKNFLVLVCIAVLLAFPIAWLVMNSWLQDFSYRIAIPLSTFLFAGLASVLVALLTVSFKAIKAASSNPVKNLRTE